MFFDRAFRYVKHIGNIFDFDPAVGVFEDAAHHFELGNCRALAPTAARRWTEGKIHER